MLVNQKYLMRYMKKFRVLRGRRILIDVPQKKESVIELSIKDEEAIMQEAMKLWTRLTVHAIGDTVESVKEGDIVYVTTGSLQNAEKVDIDGSIKLMLNEADVAIIW
jgi:hypothetical protein